MSEQTLNIPQLLAVVLVGFLAIRWYFSSTSSQGSSSSSGRRRGAPDSRHAAASRVNPAHVEQLAQMFPQLERREIMWDLQRNGGSLAATTERVLSGRGLDAPPPSFQPPLPPSSTRPGQPTTSSTPQPSHPDLITRYNLSSKLDGPASAPSSGGSSSGAKKAAWSQNKNERQLLLQRRREEMILAARRKMEERDRAGKERAA